jgi:hypothetical protein
MHSPSWLTPLAVGAALGAVLKDVFGDLIKDAVKGRYGLSATRKELYRSLAEIFVALQLCLIRVAHFVEAGSWDLVDETLEEFLRLAAEPKYDEQLKQVKQARGSLRQEVDSFERILLLRSSSAQLKGDRLAKIKAVQNMMDQFIRELEMKHIADSVLHKYVRHESSWNLKEELLSFGIGTQKLIDEMEKTSREFRRRLDDSGTAAGDVGGR